MDAATLVANKGSRVEIRTGSGEVVYGKLMSQKRNKLYTAFYVKIDGNDQRSLVAARNITRII